MMASEQIFSRLVSGNNEVVPRYTFPGIQTSCKIDRSANYVLIYCDYYAIIYPQQQLVKAPWRHLECTYAWHLCLIAQVDWIGSSAPMFSDDHDHLLAPAVRPQSVWRRINKNGWMKSKNRPWFLFAKQQQRSLHLIVAMQEEFQEEICVG